MVKKQLSFKEKVSTQRHKIVLDDLRAINSITSPQGNVKIESVNGNEVTVQLTGASWDSRTQTGGSYTPADTKTITKHTTPDYNTGGYSGTLEPYTIDEWEDSIEDFRLFHDYKPGIVIPDEKKSFSGEYKSSSSKPVVDRKYVANNLVKDIRLSERVLFSIDITDIGRGNTSKTLPYAVSFALTNNNYTSRVIETGTIGTETVQHIDETYTLDVVLDVVNTVSGKSTKYTLLDKNNQYTISPTEIGKIKDSYLSHRFFIIPYVNGEPLSSTNSPDSISIGLDYTISIHNTIRLIQIEYYKQIEDNTYTSNPRFPIYTNIYAYIGKGTLSKLNQKTYYRGNVIRPMEDTRTYEYSYGYTLDIDYETNSKTDPAGNGTGTIVSLGTLYLDGDPQVRPTRPWFGTPPGANEVGNILDYTQGQKIEIRDTLSDERNHLHWCKIVDNGKTFFVSDRVILRNITWDELEARGLVKGKKILIDGKSYLLRLLTGGEEKREGDADFSYSGGKLPNEWAKWIANESNILGLPKPSSTDLSSGSVTATKFNGEHNQFWNWFYIYSYAQEVYKHLNTHRPILGNFSAHFWKTQNGAFRHEKIGWRPVLEEIVVTPPVLKLVSREKNMYAKLDTSHITVSEVCETNMTMYAKITKYNSNGTSYTTTIGEIANKLTQSESRKVELKFNKSELFIKVENNTQVKVQETMTTGKYQLELMVIDELGLESNKLLLDFDYNGNYNPILSKAPESSIEVNDGSGFGTKTILSFTDQDTIDKHKVFYSVNGGNNVLLHESSTSGGGSVTINLEHKDEKLFINNTPHVSSNDLYNVSFFVEDNDGGKSEVSTSKVSIVRNTPPELTTLMPLIVTFSDNDEYVIKGSVVDSLEGKKISIFYSINDEDKITLMSYKSTGKRTTFNKILTNINGDLFDDNTTVAKNLTAINPNTLKVWAEDEFGKQSETSIVKFNVLRTGLSSNPSDVEWFSNYETYVPTTSKPITVIHPCQFEKGENMIRPFSDGWMKLTHPEDIFEPAYAQAMPDIVNPFFDVLVEKNKWYTFSHEIIDTSVTPTLSLLTDTKKFISTISVDGESKSILTDSETVYIRVGFKKKDENDKSLMKVSKFMMTHGTIPYPYVAFYKDIKSRVTFDFISKVRNPDISKTKAYQRTGNNTLPSKIEDINKLTSFDKYDFETLTLPEGTMVATEATSSSQYAQHIFAFNVRELNISINSLRKYLMKATIVWNGCGKGGEGSAVKYGTNIHVLQKKITGTEWVRVKTVETDFDTTYAEFYDEFFTDYRIGGIVNDDGFIYIAIGSLYPTVSANRSTIYTDSISLQLQFSTAVDIVKKNVIHINKQNQEIRLKYENTSAHTGRQDVVDIGYQYATPLTIIPGQVEEVVILEEKPNFLATDVGSAVSFKHKNHPYNNPLYMVDNDHDDLVGQVGFINAEFYPDLKGINTANKTLVGSNGFVGNFTDQYGKTHEIKPMVGIARYLVLHNHEIKLLVISNFSHNGEFHVGKSATTKVQLVPIPNRPLMSKLNYTERPN